MKIGKVIFWILFVLAIGGVWWLVNNYTPSPVTEENQEETVTDSWETYNNEKIGFEVKHPEQVEVITHAENQVSLQLVGPTQSTGTEFYDGLSLGFRTVEKTAEQTLVDVANAQLKDIVEVGAVEVEPVPSQIGGKDAIYYVSRTQGKFQVYLVEKSDTEVLEVSIFVEDPTDIGFKEIVEAMTNSLVIS